MPIQNPRVLVMEALSVIDDVPGHAKQPRLENGIHLEWSPGQDAGFPLKGGYFLFRRGQGPEVVTSQCLMMQLSDVDVKVIESKAALSTPIGSLTSISGKLLKGAQPPGVLTIVGWGFTLLEDQPLKFDLSPGRTATRIIVTGHFLGIPPQSSPLFRAEFALTDVGTVTAPVKKEGASFQPFKAKGKPAGTCSVVKGVEINKVGALVCNATVEVTLPGPCSLVRATAGKGGVTIESFEESGALAQRKQFAADSFGMTDVSGSRVTRVVFTGAGVLIYGVQYELTDPPRQVNAVGSLRGSQVFTRSVTGAAQEQFTIDVDKTEVDSLLLSGGPAAILDICYVARPVLATAATPQPAARIQAPNLPGQGWELVPNLTTAIKLPLILPTYPASAGAESIKAAAAIAKPRVQYGAWQDSFQPAAGQIGKGKITLTNGSPVVIGSGTGWTSEFTGKMIGLPNLPADYTAAYAVMVVLDPERLVLSRPYSGANLTNAPYQVVEGDHFAELHDQIASLFNRPDDMRAATAPPPLDEGSVAGGKLVVAFPGSPIITGIGTQWTQTLSGAYIEIGPKWFQHFYVEERSVFRIQSLNEALQQITLEQPYPGSPTIANLHMKADFRIFARAAADAADSGAPAFELKPMDFLELASLVPSYAQALGLYWNDRSAQREGVYDYIVLADHKNLFLQQAANALTWLNGNPDFSSSGVDGYVVAGIKHTGSPPLPAPTQLALYRLPTGGARLSVSRPKIADSDVGISVLEAASWPTRSDPAPVMLNLWRLYRGTDAKNLTPAGKLAKYEDLDKLLPTTQTPDPDPATQPPSLPPGWPNDPIHFIDSLLDVGWYSYQVNAIDRWGRWSLPSGPILWVGDHDPAAPQIVDAVHLADHTAPPPPTGVFAWALDPADPFLFKDAAYQAWKNQWTQANLTEPVGLRIQWRWPWSHRNQGADLREFRIYYQSTPLNARTGRSISVVASDPTHSVVTLEMDALDMAPANAYANASLQIAERSFPIVGSTSGPATLQLIVVNGGPSKDEAPVANATAAIVIPEGHPLAKTLLDPRNWETWLTSVPENAQVLYEVDMLEDPDITLFDNSNNTFTGSVALWNTQALQLDSVPAGDHLANIRPGIDVIALLSLSPPAYHVLDIKSVNASALQVVPTHAQDLVAGRSYQWRLGPATAGLQGIAGTWNSATRQFLLDGNANLTGVRPGIDLIYIPTGSSPTPADLSLFFSIEAVDAVARVLMLGPSAVLPTRPSFFWQIGRPLRNYDLFLPSGPSAPKGEVKRLTKAFGGGPALSEPVAYGSVAVSSADLRDEIDDWMPGRGLKGNESLLSAPAAVFRVFRQAPPEPDSYDWTGTHLNATPADYRGESFFTVRWKKPAAQGDRYSAHICRAMDDSLFVAHWNLRTVLSTPPAQMPKPDRQKLAGLLDKIAATTDYASALSSYRQFEDAALSWLAGLVELEDAYMQITIDPLSLGDPANQDRLGPDDDPKTFTATPAVCAYFAVLEGKSSNRYFFRVVLIDPAQNRGKMGKPTPPVYLPKVVPPRVPVITKVLGGDRQITITWASNREPDLAEYRVYRADSEDAARDIRLMTLVSTQKEKAPPELRAAEVEWVDSPVPGKRTLYYRIVSLDTVGNVSVPSSAAAARAFDHLPPPPPAWTRVQWVHVDEQGVEHPLTDKPPDGALWNTVVALTWSTAERSITLVQRREVLHSTWQQASGWVQPSGFEQSTQMWTYVAYDTGADAATVNLYRIQAESAAGNLANTFDERELDPA
jgi:hypothetical protein